MGKKKGGSKHKNKKGSPNSKKASPAVSKKKTALPVAGLMNLGNTCFFNSVMQCIGQTHYLRFRLYELTDSSRKHSVTLKSRENETQLVVMVPDSFESLTQLLHSFMKEVATPTPGRTLNPRPIFSKICEAAPRFRGYQQQDSQELLRYLLDALKTEEVKRVKKGILAAFGVSSGKKDTLKHLSQEDKDSIKIYGNAANRLPTYVDEVFGGVLISTITCDECHSSSTLHENYLDLSLPVPRDQVSRREGGRNWIKSKKKEKVGSGADIFTEAELLRDGMMRGGGVEGGGEGTEIANVKETAVSKHQMKKTKKKARKGKGKHSLYDLPNVLTNKKKDGDNDDDENEEEKEDKIGDSLTSKHDLVEEAVEEGQQKLEEDEKEAHTMADKEQKEEEREEGEKEEEEEEEEENEVRDNQENGDRTSEQNVTKVEGEEDKTEIQTKEAGDIEIENATTQQQESEATPTCSKTTTEAETSDIVSDHTTVKPTSTYNQTTAPGDLEPTETVATATTNNDASPWQPEGADEPDNAEPEEFTKDGANHAAKNFDFKEDSLEGCLRKFCSVEVLSGVNRFYCSVCSERKTREKRAASAGGREMLRDMATGSSEEVEVKEEGVVVEEEKVDKVEEEENQETINNIEERFEEGEKDEECLQRESIQTTELQEKEKENYIEKSNEENVEDRLDDKEPDTQQSPDQIAESSPEPGRNSANVDDEEEEVKVVEEEELEEVEDEGKKDDVKEEVVFRDARKQLLIKTLPPILTLHLKRFLHENRHLRKNGCHIDFPDLLNMAPFILPDLKTPCDGGGRILYSLYAVVEHAGGMQGGHYTAYVRVRKTQSLSVSGVSGISNDSRDVNGLVVDSEDLPATAGACTTNTTTDDQRSATSGKTNATRDQNSEVPNSDQSGTCICHSGTTTTNERLTSEATGEPSNTTNDHSGTTKAQTNTTSDHSGTTKAQTNTTSDNSGTTNPNQQNRNQNSHQKHRNFDLSLTDGEWYHVSDTHVRTATPTEVHKCQAYLLFYEHLPLQKDP